MTYPEYGKSEQANPQTSGPYPPQQYPPAAAQPYGYGQQPMSPAPQQVIVVQGNQRETSSLATMAMVFAVLGVIGGCCTFGVFSIVSVVLGHLAWKETKSGQKGGHGMTVAALVISYIMLIPAIFFSISMVLQGAGGVTPVS